MKKLLLGSCLFLCAFFGYSEPLSGGEILAFVRSNLPVDPLKLTGSLKVKAKNGFTKANLPVVMELEWGAVPPMAKYRIGDESLTITWPDENPVYAFSNPENQPTSPVLDTGITWADLSFSVLWWPNAKLIREEKKINRDCYVVDVPVPESEKTMRLWIEKNMGMLLEATTLDAKQRELSRLRIVSIKKMDGMWVAKDLELRDKKTGTKTTLQISDLEWENGSPEPDTAAAFDPAESVNRAAFDLYRQLAAQEEGNLFFSPYSISSALAMTYGGARGETAEQINRVLRFGGPAATHPAFAYLRRELEQAQAGQNTELNIANALWAQQDHSFLPDYLALIREFYDGSVYPVDFRSNPEGTRREINSWVENQTRNRIQDLLVQDALTPLTRLVLVNAIYFKGRWAAPFNPEDTRPAPFRLPAGGTVQVPTMMQTEKLPLATARGFQALELPYADGRLSMLILLPEETAGLGGLGESLSLSLLSGLQFKERDIMVRLPKFSMEWSMEMSRQLAALGMPQPFSDQADFSGMDGSGTLFLDRVIHKAFIDVNEEGTEAAAATAVGIRATSVPPQFIADHPFLFLIRENSTGTILFAGRITDPSK